MGVTFIVLPNLTWSIRTEIDTERLSCDKRSYLTLVSAYLNVGMTDHFWMSNSVTRAHLLYLSDQLVFEIDPPQNGIAHSSLLRSLVPYPPRKKPPSFHHI